MTQQPTQAPLVAEVQIRQARHLAAQRVWDTAATGLIRTLLPELARQLEQAEREKERALKDLAEIHAYNCGCDQPGRLDVCVAQPVVLFAALSEQNTKPSGEVGEEA